MNIAPNPISPRRLRLFVLTVFMASFFCPQALYAAVSGMDSGFVIVLPFAVQGDNAERLEEEVPVLLGQRLVAKGVPVMPHEDMLELLASLNLSSLDVATVRRVLAQSGAEAAVYGSYAQVGPGFNINARLVNAKEAEGVKSYRVEQSDVGNLLFGVEDLSGRLVSELRKFSVIAKVEVRGTESLDPDVVLLRINTRQGDPIDPAALDRELKKIWELGYFSDIVLELEQTPDGINLIYNVKEKPRLARIVIENNDALSASDIRAVMGTNPGAVLNDKVLFTDIQAIQEAYRKKGYYLARVNYRLEEDAEKGGTNLVIDVNEGNRLFITKVTITGNKEMSARKIKKEMALTTRGMFSFITGSGVLKEELLERDVAAITNFYMNEGYIDIAVTTPQVEYKEKGIEISLHVSEGKRYKVSGISFSGELIDSDEVLAEQTGMRLLGKSKDWFNLSVMQADEQKISNFYADYGYAFAAVSPQPRKDLGNPDRPTVVINYHISKNQKVYVRNIIIEGNTTTRDNVILREMRLVDGDMFSGTKLKRSMRRLNSLGYFESAESELIPTADDSEVDLKIKLRERSTGALMGGFGYSTYSKFGITASIQETNLWGKGYNLGFYTLFSGNRNAYNLNFTNPRVNDTDLSLGLDAYMWEDDYTDYDRDTTGGGIRVGYPLGEYTGIVLGYKAEFYKLYNFDDDVSPILTQYEGDRVASVASARITRDTTDRSRPTDGTMIQLRTDYGGGILGGDDSFVKVITEWNGYKKITENSVFHVRLRGGAMFENDKDNKPPVFERFWMGGIESVRGYKARDIVPRVTTYKPSGDRVGGTRMAFANIEYIIQVSPEIGLNLVPFFDIGVNIDHEQDYDLWDEKKRSVGMELRWRSPMGDLRFSYGYPLDDAWNGDKMSGRFEFSIGQFF